jgi:hypothetical protein
MQANSSPRSSHKNASRFNTTRPCRSKKGNSHILKLLSPSATLYQAASPPKIRKLLCYQLPRCLAGTGSKNFSYEIDFLRDHQYWTLIEHLQPLHPVLPFLSNTRSPWCHGSSRCVYPRSWPEWVVPGDRDPPEQPVRSDPDGQSRSGHP